LYFIAGGTTFIIDRQTDCEHSDERAHGVHMPNVQILKGEFTAKIIIYIFK